LFDVRAEFDLGRADAVGLTVRGVPIVYDVEEQRLSCREVSAPLKLAGGKIRLRVLADRGSVEVFGNDGRVALSVGVTPSEAARQIEVTSKGGLARPGSRWRSCARRGADGPPPRVTSR
jgi:hypothetical protein